MITKIIIKISCKRKFMFLINRVRFPKSSYTVISNIYLFFLFLFTKLMTAKRLVIIHPHILLFLFLHSTLARKVKNGEDYRSSYL